MKEAWQNHETDSKVTFKKKKSIIGLLFFQMWPFLESYFQAFLCNYEG